MEQSVSLSYRYHDNDLVELNASVWNGKFGGATRLYISHGELSEAADILTGFPANSTDEREVMFGVFGSESGGGAMSLKFRCVDRAGHCQIQLRLESDPLLQEPPLERVELCAAVEPAALDRFVEQMRVVNASLAGSAMLQLA